MAAVLSAPAAMNPMRAEWRGAIEATLQGLINAVSPFLLFVAILGPLAAEAGIWACLVTASVVPLLALLLRGQPALLTSARIASLTVYTGMVAQLCLATGSPDVGGNSFTLWHLSLGLAAGSVMFLLASLMVATAGLLKLGNLFKLIPTPVTAGISNGTALILLTLAMQQVTPLSPGRFGALLTALAMAGSYLAWPMVQRRVASLTVLPAILFASFVGILLFWWLGPTPASQTSGTASDWGWVSLRLWPMLGDQNWQRLLAVGLPGAATLAFVMVLETFTTAAALEARFGVRIDHNRELFVLGCSNMVSALMGGIPSTGSPIRSIASWLQGARGYRAAAIALVLTCLALLWLGQWLLAMPVGMVGGLFLIQAVLTANPGFVKRLTGMVRDRLGRTASAPVQAGVAAKENTQDLGFWITVVITLVTFLGGLIWACAIGVGLSCLLVLKRLSDNLVAQWAYLDQYRSRRVRSYGESMTLARLHRRVAVLRLTGHLFFGNSMRMTELADELPADTQCVAIDVRQVLDVDTSGVDALKWLVNTLHERQLLVVLAGSSQTRCELLKAALQGLPGATLCIDLDRGLEACEQQVLANATAVAVAVQPNPLTQNTLLQGLTDDEITAVLLLGAFRDVPKGGVLFHKDSLADGVWLLESGIVSILNGKSPGAARLATFGPGQFLGEMSLIDGKTRSATAFADTSVRALLLDNRAVEALTQHHGEAALKITRNIANELSMRVRFTSAVWADDTSDAGTVWSNSSLGNPSQF